MLSKNKGSYTVNISVWSELFLVSIAVKLQS